MSEKTLKSELTYQGSFLLIQKEEVLDHQGVKRIREYVLHPGATVIVPEKSNGNLVLVKQYRHALKRSFLEFPAGKLDPGEELHEAARRELREETGYTSTQWKKLGRVHPCIGYSNEFIDAYFVDQLSFVGAQLDPGENLEVVEMSLDQVRTAIHQGEITDGKTIFAFFLYLEMKAGKFQPLSS